jgi:hypothetical protein
MKITKTTRIDTGDGTLLSVKNALVNAHKNGVPSDAIITDVDLGYEVHMDIKLDVSYTGSSVQAKWTVED